MILAKLSGLQKIFTQLQAGQYLPLKKLSLSRCLQSDEKTANRFPRDKLNDSCVMVQRPAVSSNTGSIYQSGTRPQTLGSAQRQHASKGVIDWRNTWKTSAFVGNVSEPVEVSLMKICTSSHEREKVNSAVLKNT